MNETHYIGLDLASEVTTGAVIDSRGREMLRTQIATSAENLRAFIGGIPRPRQVVFEEGTQAHWAYTVLRNECDKIVICDAGQLGKKRSKSDDQDALNLAKDLRLGAVKPVYHSSDIAFERLRELAGDYSSLVQDSTRYKNRIRSIFRARGIKISQKVYDPSVRQQYAEALKLKERRDRFLRLSKFLDGFKAAKSEALKAFTKEAKRHACYKSVSSIPRFAEVSTSFFVAIVFNPHRFKNRRQFISYCGLSVESHDTGVYGIKHGRIERKRLQYTRGLTRKYNRTLKRIFKWAARQLATFEWKKIYEQQLEAGIKKELILLNFARKLAAIALHLAKHGGEYREQQVM